MADDLAARGELGARSRVVEAPDQASGRGERLVGDGRIEVGRDVTLEEAEHLASACVAAEVARRCVEPALVKQGEERAHELRVRLGRATHRVADPDDPCGDAPSGQRDLLHEPGRPLLRAESLERRGAGARSIRRRRRPFSARPVRAASGRSPDPAKRKLNFRPRPPWPRARPRARPRSRRSRSRALS